MKKIVFILMLVGVFLTSCQDKQNKYDFNLKGEDSFGNIKEFSLKDFAGENLIIYFGYGLCPDVCPVTMDKVSGILDELIEQKSIKPNEVKMIFISLDPQRDMPHDMNGFVREFYANSQALIPTLKQLEKLAKIYGVKYQKIPLEDSELGYSVAHSSSIYIFDKKGQFKGEISNLTNKNILKKLKEFGILKN